MSANELADIARAMVAPGKGILAADESDGTIKKRFDTIGVPSTEDHRRAYREMLFTTPGAEEFISGVILYDETARQKAADGQQLIDVLAGKGIVAGIKVDKGAKPLAGVPGETVTEGLDGLRPRLEEYRTMGCRFTKWRAVIAVDVRERMPTDACIAANAHALARYAALCVEQGLVPIVEPEVLMDGTHSLEDCYAATERVLQWVFSELYQQRVPFEQMILKPNMVVSGAECPKQATAGEIADATLRCFQRTVPAAVPGIVFLSGGQSEVEATANLNEINRRARDCPWKLSFSYGRALQASALQAWQGKTENEPSARQAFYHRA
ncbi:MAG: class I fructose-bisphosphate aldolase, partial [Thermoanaerobaculia bacterium]